MTGTNTFRVSMTIALSLGTVATIWAGSPDFDYETSLPGYYLSSGRGIEVDAEGNAYVIARFYENQNTLDILVAKLDPMGTPLWELTILGGGNHNIANDIALGPDGGVWITGRTSSGSFPIVDGLDDVLDGFTDVFVTKLDPADGTILYSTFLGGDYVDHGESITLDEAGDIYVVGSTGSTDFPTTSDAYQGGPSAPLNLFTDAFITKISSDGRTILYSTYFGGFEDDAAEHVGLDAAGNIILSGRTNADDFPLVKPLMTTPHGIFVSRFSPDGSVLEFSTYLGGSNVEHLRGMAVDPQGFAYLTGETRSVDFPSTPGAFQETFVGDILGCEEGFPAHDVNCFDGFVTKLATDGKGLAYSTFLGGSIDDRGSDIVVDAGGYAYVVGYTISPDYLGSGNDFGSIFALRLSPTGSNLDYLVTKRSPSANAGHGVAVDGSCDTYVTGAIDVPANVYVAKIATSIVVSTPEGTSSPGVASLGPNVPNPFAIRTELAYLIPDEGHVFLAVYDASGRWVRTLVDAFRERGMSRVTWDGTDGTGSPLPAGVYFYRMRTNGEERTGRVLLVR